MQHLQNKRCFSFLIALLLGILAGILSYWGIFLNADQYFSTTLYNISPLQNNAENITIIDIDDATIESYGDTSSWSGDVVAEAILLLSSEGADVIGLDTELWNTCENSDEQEAFEDACEEAGTVVSISAFSQKQSIDSINDSESLSPDESMANTTTVHPNETSSAPESSEETEHFLQPFTNIFNTDTQTSSNMICNVISFADLMSGNYDASYLSGCVVFIGEYDSFYGNWMEQMFSHNNIKDINTIVQAILCALLSLTFYLLASQKKVIKAIFSCIGLILFTFICAFLCYKIGLCFYLLVPTLFFLIGLILSLVQRTISNISAKKKMEQTLKLYVDSQVVDEITEKSPKELASVSERKDIAVLFVDIRGFTSMSESLEPEQVVEILNEYLSLVARAIQKYDGTLDKFIGDAAMAVFNAPKDLDDYLYRAVLAAEEIARSSSYIREKYLKRYGKTVSYGIGINCGEAIVGNVGSESRMDYTAIGDTVNVASRLESHAAPGQILISEEMHQRLLGRIKTTCMGPMKLKGKSKEVTVYQVDHI